MNKMRKVSQQNMQAHCKKSKGNNATRKVNFNYPNMESE